MSNKAVDWGLSLALIGCTAALSLGETHINQSAHASQSPAMTPSSPLLGSKAFATVSPQFKTRTTTPNTAQATAGNF